MEEARAQYDAVAARGSQTQGQRAQGPAYLLKTYHNAVKRTLLREYTKKGCALLDIACGRGGDIAKWFDLRLGSVKGIDISHAEIEEAGKRFDYWQTRNPNSKLKCTFEAMDALDLNEVPGSYDVVSCMFALHYFWGCQDHAERLLGLVAECLRPGGYFLGTLPDADAVRSLGDYKGDLLSLQPLWTEDSEFGMAYACSLGDTVVTGHATEYLVSKLSLERLAAIVGMELVAYDEFAPHYPEGSPDDLHLASRMYASFALKKNL